MQDDRPQSIPPLPGEMKSDRVNQHSVWRTYLAEWRWPTDNRVFVYDKGAERPLNRRPKSLDHAASNEYFYKLPSLDRADIQQLVDLVEGQREPLLRDRFREITRNLAINTWVFETHKHEMEQIEELERRALNWRQNALEIYYSKVESRFSRIFTKMKNGDMSFYNAFQNNGQDLRDFTEFLSAQIHRTRRSRLNAISQYTAKYGRECERISHVLVLFVSATLSFYLFMQSHVRNLVILDNETDIEFITGDQPAVTIEFPGQENDGIKTIYFPISPRRAYFLTGVDGLARYKSPLTKKEVDRLNAWIFQSSHQQVFATSNKFLTRASGSVGDQHTNP